MCTVLATSNERAKNVHTHVSTYVALRAFRMPCSSPLAPGLHRLLRALFFTGALTARMTLSARAEQQMATLRTQTAAKGCTHFLLQRMLVYVDCLGGL